MGVISNGTTLLDAGALDSGVATGNMTLIKTLTASSSATLSFLNGADNVVFDGTYKEYEFHCINIHPATDRAFLQFQVDTGTNTNYNQAITSTFHHVFHNEADTNTALNYVAGKDLAQGTGFQTISYNTGNANDECNDGTLSIFEPSSSTFIKNFYSRFQTSDDAGFSDNTFAAGYVNTTTALTRIQFKMSGGNIDSGTIKMYGIK